MSRTDLTHDYLLNGKVSFKQKLDGYRTAIDPILLAASLSIRSRPIKLLDMGAGAGAVGLCCLYHQPMMNLVALEKEPDLCAIAKLNLSDNGYETQSEVICGTIGTDDCKTLILSNSFDHVMMNPPFFRLDQTDPSPDRLKAVAHSDDQAGLAIWIEFALRACAVKGFITMIIPTNRVGEAIVALQTKAAEISLLPLYPFMGEESKRTLIRATKGGKGGFRICAGLILHDLSAKLPNHHPDRKRYTQEMLEILRGERKISWS